MSRRQPGRERRWRRRIARPAGAARGAAAIAGLLLVAGCASAPPIEPPPVELAVPDGWTAPGAARGAAAAAGSAAATGEEAEQGWWREFGDPRLEQLIEEALAHNHDLEAAAARLEAAAAGARIAGADLWPAVDAVLSGARRKQNFIGFPVPGGEDRVLSSLSTSVALSATASWEADLWGRIRAGKRAALADAQVAAASYAGARLSLAARTSRAWFVAVAALEQVRLAESTAASYARSAAQARNRYRRGLRPSLDLRLALSSLATANAAAELRRQQLDSAVRGIEILLGRYPGAALAVADSLATLAPPPVPAGLPSELLWRRPDLVAAERQLAAADARLAEAWRAQLPRLSLTGSAGTASNALRDLLDSSFSVWSIAGNLLQPLFQGGRLRANVKLNEARVREALAVYASALLEAFSEVEGALSAEHYLARREAEQVRAAAQAVAAQRLAEERYRSGLEDYVTVLEAQRRALQAQSQVIAVHRQRLEARVDLHVALGGGFDARDPGQAPLASGGPHQAEVP